MISVGSNRSMASSFKRHSFRLSTEDPHLSNDDIESESVSEAGDIGDKVLHSNRYSGSTVLSSTLEVASPTNIFLRSEKQKQNEVEVPWLLKYVSSLLHLAFFGILGVLTRYALEKLFGPEMIGATSDRSYMYSDLPSNMVGSFLMGWLGVVFKADIAEISDQLAIGLTTGYLGSLTTFSGWNQKALELSVEGHWIFAFLAFMGGLFLVAESFIFGVETAKAFRWVLKRIALGSQNNFSSYKTKWKVDNSRRHWIILGILILLLAIFYGLFGVLETRDFDGGSSVAQLWLACMVGPLGVWIRWFLARLNGRGLGKPGLLKWIPFGTLIANVSAACVMAALATIKKAVNTKSCDTVATGIQFGVMGCLSTVSTFIAEFIAMRQSQQSWRAYAYALITIASSFVLGTLIYSLPVWIKGYDH